MLYVSLAVAIVVLIVSFFVPWRNEVEIDLNTKKGDRILSRFLILARKKALREDDDIAYRKVLEIERRCDEASSMKVDLNTEIGRKINKEFDIA